MWVVTGTELDDWTLGKTIRLLVGMQYINLEV